MNKGMLSKSKLENKRSQKEAIKRIKTKRQAGTTANATTQDKQKQHQKEKAASQEPKI